MSHVLINGRNISRTWLNRYARENREAIESERMIRVFCLLTLLDPLIQVQDALDQLVAEGSVRELPDGRYEAVPATAVE